MVPRNIPISSAHSQILKLQEKLQPAMPTASPFTPVCPLQCGFASRSAVALSGHFSS